MSSKLNPLRRVEAKRAITSMLAYMSTHDEFDINAFVDQLAEVMTQTPPIVDFIARQLKEWNTHHPSGEFLPPDEGMAEQIVEFVLDHAAIYRGETNEDPTSGDASPTEELHTERKVADQFDAVVAFLRAVAAGRMNGSLAETHANNMESIAGWLKKTKFRYVTE